MFSLYLAYNVMSGTYLCIGIVAPPCVHMYDVCKMCNIVFMSSPVGSGVTASAVGRGQKLGKRELKLSIARSSQF